MFMRAQRVRGGGSRIEMQDIKWTAEGAVKGYTRCKLSILRRRAYVSCREYEGIPQEHGSFREAGWYRG